MAKAKKNPKFISELFANEELQEKKVEMVKEVVEEMRDNDVFIDSCKMVTKEVQKKCFQRGNPYQFGITEQQACKIMRELGMRYKKVQHIALSANSERSLVLRQQWAIKYQE